MLIKTEIDITGALATLDLILKKVPYATNNALTRTAKELVVIERDELKSEFELRKGESFLPRLIAITKYSRPDDLWTRVAIDPNRARGGRVLLGFFEDGGMKEPQQGSELAIAPYGSAARPSFAQKITPSLLYKALKIKPHTTAGGIVQFKGDKRTFVIEGVGVFQRTSSRQRTARANKGVAGGKGKDDDVVLLYSFKPNAPLKQQMHFVKTAREFVRRRFGELWREEFAREMAGRRR